MGKKRCFLGNRVWDSPDSWTRPFFFSNRRFFIGSGRASNGSVFVFKQILIGYYLISKGKTREKQPFSW